MKGYIYAHKSPSNKYYIGQTVTSLQKRFGPDGKRYFSQNTPFYNAIKKYGWENFEHIVVETIETDCEEVLYQKLNELEIFYIKKYNSKTPNGYNIREGGNGPLGEETKKKISKKLKNKPKTEEHKLKLKESGLKREPPSAEVLKKRSESLKGKIPWNKGLTQENSEIIKQMANKNKENYK